MFRTESVLRDLAPRLSVVVTAVAESHQSRLDVGPWVCPVFILSPRSTGHRAWCQLFSHLLSER